MSSSRPLLDAREWPAGSLPALWVLVLGCAIVLLRAPLPIDETRYLEVFHESLRGSPLLLTLSGEPYAEKPPLLFWLGRALTWLALPPDFSLRCVPVLSSALSVLFVARIGARLGSKHAGWMQAALWIPALAGQFLFFDSLLAVLVIAALDAWVRQRDVQAGVWSAAALLAKGPVAYLFLVPFLWSLTPLRTPRPGEARRAALFLAAALVPLAAWALSAAAQGGPEFASALLWDRWAGRIGSGATHSRSLFFYLPVVLVGALPATLVLFQRSGPSAPEWSRRTWRALLLVLVTFTLIRGKQAHYLVPAAPMLALALAWRLEQDARAAVWLRRGACVQLVLLVALVVAAAVSITSVPRLAEAYGPRAHAWVASRGHVLPLALAGTSALLGLALVLRARLSPLALVVVSTLSSGACLLPIHHVAGVLLFPHELERALATHRGPIAFLGSSQHGIYALLAEGRPLEKLRDDADVVVWSARHTAGIVLVDPDQLDAGVPPGLATVTTDQVHRSQVLVLRAE
jgi:4-amino-4-deoxy-L-arabinose transferase-like glycosyltransferase